MKKEKLQPQHKSAKKKAKESVQQKISKLLATITSELSKDGAKIAIDIEKEAKKLAKKITKHFPGAKEDTKLPVTAAAASPAKEVKVAKTNPATKATAPKPVATKAVAAKPVAVKAPVSKPVAKPTSAKSAAKNGAVKTEKTIAAKAKK